MAQLVVRNLDCQRRNESVPAGRSKSVPVGTGEWVPRLASWDGDWVAVGKGGRSALSTSAVATTALIHSLNAQVFYASCFA